MALVERTLGLRAVIAISLSGSLGSGIFVLPGMAAAKTGPSVFMAYMLAGLVVLPAAMSKAELGTAMPTAGGTYVYIERTFGPLVGTVAGAGLWLSLLLKSAFALVGFAAYLWVFADLPIKPTALLLLVAIVALNIVGVQAVSRFQQVVISVSFATLIGLAIWGGLVFEPDLMDPTFTHGAGGFFAASAFVFVSYAGVTKVAAIANEVTNPGRNLPVGILVSIGMLIGLYGLVSLILVGNIPVADLHDDIRPIFTLAERLGGPTLGIIAAVVAVATMTSMANAGLLSSSRFPFAMSRDHLLPNGLARIHSRLKTPVNSIVATGLVMAVMIATLDVEKIAKLASAFMIMLYVAENVTVIVLRESRARWYAPVYRSPLYPFTQIFGTVSGLALLGYMGLMVPLALGIIGVPSLVLYALYGRLRAQRRGVFSMMGRRTDLLGPAEPIVGLDEKVRQKTVVAVPLLGTERSPEMVVELGAALAEGKPMEVLQVTELPQQTILDAELVDTGQGKSVRRRVMAMTDDSDLDMRCSEVVTHDVAHSILAVSTRTHCDWVVMEWRGRSQRLIVRNPMAWLLDQLECNLALYRCAGVRRIRDIMVYPRPGPHDALLAHTADQIARALNARLWFCRFVPEEASAVHARSATEYVEQLRQMARAPSDVLILRGRRRVPTILAEAYSHDLLILSPAHQVTLRNSIFGTAEDKLVEQAPCSVVVLSTPRSQTHRAFSVQGDAAETARQFNLSDFVIPSVVGARLRLAKKDALFAHFGRRFSGLFHDVTNREIAKALWRREEAQNTAVGEGVAFPHITLARIPKTFLGVFTTEKPVHYEAPDGEPVDVFFVLVGRQEDRQVHLLLLSSISRMLLDTKLLESLRAAKTDEELLSAVEQAWEQTRANHLQGVGLEDES